jgi:transposase
VYKRFHSWVRTNVIRDVWRCLLQEYADSKLDGNPGWFRDVFIDTTLIKNIAGVDCVGKNPTDRGRKGTKVSVLCDAERIPISCVHFPANRNDCTTVQDTVDAVQCELRRDGRRGVCVVGDKAYSTENIKTFLKQRKMRSVTESKKNAKVKRKLNVADMQRLKKRHVVENLFCRVKQFKRIRNRFTTLSSVFEAEVQTTLCILLLGRLEKMQDW